jgi:hypothetical protein
MPPEPRLPGALQAIQPQPSCQVLSSAYFWMAFWVCFSGSLGGAGRATIWADMPAAAVLLSSCAVEPLQMQLASR